MGGSKNMIDKIISFLPVRALMGFIVEFDSQNRLESFVVAKKKVNMLSVNTIHVGAIFSIIACLCVKQIAKFYF